jgi:hypothetical protein
MNFRRSLDAALRDARYECVAGDNANSLRTVTPVTLGAETIGPAIAIVVGAARQ